MRKLTALCCLWAAVITTAQAQIAPNERYWAYVETYAPMAVAEMQAFRIPASITLAQGLLESGGGSSSLARESNNHFGIKCGSSWTGRTHHQEDDDYDGDRLVHSCFRAYADPAESYRDHSTFLTSSSRYASLFDLDPADYKGWARGLKAAGYATSSTYAPKLIEIIEVYELTRFDQGMVGLPLADRTLTEGARRRGPSATRSSSSYGRPKLSGAKLPKKSRTSTSSPRDERVAGTTSGGAAPAQSEDRSSLGVQKVNDVEYLTARAGETVNELAARGRVGARDVIKYNEGLSSITESLGEGQRVYLQPKRSNYRGTQKTHRVAPTETTQTVADRYGLSTSSLKERNRIADTEEPVRGETLVIRGTRSRKDDPRVMSATARRAEIAKLQAERSQPAPARTEEVASVVPASSPASPPRTSTTGTSRREVPTVIILPPVGAPAQASASTGGVNEASVMTSPSRSGNAARVKPAPPKDARPSAPRYLTVRKGDTLFALSRASGVSVAEIRALNGLEGDALQVGQRLLVAR